MQASELIAAIDGEIGCLEQARALLTGNETGPAHRGRPAGAFFGDIAHRKRRTISAAGRARIAAAQKTRWAKLKRAAKRAAAAASAKVAVKPRSRKRVKRALADKAKIKKKAVSKRAPATDDRRTR
jgi:hypothetical protein